MKLKNAVLSVLVFGVLQGLASASASGSTSSAPLQSESEATSVCDREILNPPFDFRLPVLVGEMHGTEQSRPFIVAMICAALGQNGNVTLALEMPQDAVDDALASRSGAPTFWRMPQPDGRASAAMRALLIDLKPLSATDRLKIIGFGNEDGESDTVYAERIRTSARPGDAVIVLVGNFHARRPTPGNDGETLTTALGDVVNVRVANSTPGSAWVCTPECGVHQFPGSSGPLPLGFNSVRAANGYDYFYVVQTFTPSDPF